MEEGRLVVEFVRPHEPHRRSLAGGLVATDGAIKPEPVDFDASVGQGIAEEWREYLTREETALRRQTP